MKTIFLLLMLIIFCYAEPKSKIIGKYLYDYDECRSDEFDCGKDDQCIVSEWVCDGFVDCYDGSDESSSICDAKCTSDEFSCGDDDCIVSEWVCDGFEDCYDGSDESSSICDTTTSNANANDYGDYCHYCHRRPYPLAPHFPGCFPGTSMVTLDGGGKRSMENLRNGDKIMTVENGNLKPTIVVGFLDKKVNQTTYYINLTLEDNRSLFISSRHVMFIKGHNNIIQSILAKDVCLGDMVVVDDSEKIGFVPVKDITVELKMGAYVPLTYAGTLLVDGVLVSSYTNADHWLAHIALSPLRWWPNLLLDTERSQNLDGLRIFPRMMRNLGNILGLVTMADGKMETIENHVLGLSTLAMENIDKTEF